MPTAQIGWGRDGWNVGAWNTDPDALAILTGQQLETQIDFGGYWNADEWSSGAWNIGHGAVLTGDGNVFAISTLTQLTASVGNIITIANANISISGQLANISLTFISTNGPFDLPTFSKLGSTCFSLSSNVFIISLISVIKFLISNTDVMYIASV